MKEGDFMGRVIENSVTTHREEGLTVNNQMVGSGLDLMKDTGSTMHANT